VQRKPFALVISGPSGAGKTTFVRLLLERHADLRFSVSATTRARRDGEQNGREYHFLDAAEFERRVQAGQFLEHAEVHGSRYGTLKSEVLPVLAADQLPILDVDVQGGVRLKRLMLNDAVLVFLLPPSMRRLEEQLRGRKTETEDKIQRRLQRAPDEIRALVDYDYVVVNDTVPATHADLESILRAERLRRPRLTDDAGGPDVAAEYLREWAPRPLAP
jgi:guanylate kinase